MRIAVFGGTGATGRLLIDQALDRGLSVTAYARHPEKLGIEDDRLTVVAGELSDSAAIDEPSRDRTPSSVCSGRADR